MSDVIPPEKGFDEPGEVQEDWSEELVDDSDSGPDAPGLETEELDLEDSE